MSERDENGRGRPMGLEEALDAARSAAPERPELPPELATRLLADARAVQSERPGPAHGVRHPILRGVAWLAWPDSAALAASLAAGLWLGLAPPAPVAGPLGGLQAVLRGDGVVPGAAGDLLAPVDAGLIAAAEGGEDV